MQTTERVPNEYTVVHTIREGRIILHITRRIFREQARYSFHVVKEYLREGAVAHSKWMEVSQVPDLVAALEKARSWITTAIKSNTP